MRLKKGSIVELNRVSQHRNICCYGIGEEFKRIIENSQGEEWTKKIKLLIDGDHRKVGLGVKIGDVKGTIDSIENAKKSISADDIFVITSIHFAEIVDDLNRLKELDDIDCYIFHFAIGFGEEKGIRIRTTLESIIPPIIHYCWFGKNKKPEIYERYIKGWHEKCPDYEIIEWNESNCNVEEIAFTKEAYKHRKYGFVSDYFRLKCIYEHGGIYLDTDVELVKPLDDLLYNDSFCGMQFPGEVAFGLGYGAQKGNSIVKRIMSIYEKMEFVPDGESMNEVPCPFIQTDLLKSLGMKPGNKLQIVEGMTIYPMEVLSPKNLVTHELNITENTYAIHHFDGSWATGKRKEEELKRLQSIEQVKKLFV